MCKGIIFWKESKVVRWSKEVDKEEFQSIFYFWKNMIDLK
jgi:hypothetical protein